MAEIVSGNNFPQRNIQDQSFIIADAAAGQNTVSVNDPSEWAVNDFIILGNPGQDEGEKLQVQSVTGQVVVFTTNLQFKHFNQEMTTRIFGDQILFYAAPAPSDNSIPLDTSAALIAGPTNILPDEAFTSFLYNLGGSAYWYKYVFKNSFTGAVGMLADVSWVRGGNFGHYVTVESVRRGAGLMNNPYITDDDILEAIEDAEGIVKASIAIGGYILPLPEPTPFLARKATKLLAEGNLLTDFNTSGNSDIYAQGSDKLKKGQAICDGIEDHTLMLLDPQDNTPSLNPGGDDVSSSPSPSDIMFSTPPDPTVDSTLSDPSIDLGPGMSQDSWTGRNTRF